MHTLEQLRSGELQGLRRLKLSCGLTEFPREIFSLSDTLEILDLTGNQLSSLPDDLEQLINLKVIFCSQNQFTQLPEVLGRCNSLSMVGFKSNQIADVPAASLPAQLRWLILTDNRVQSLPENIGQCSRLQKLMLAGNQLSSLPESLALCHRLELIRMSANKLEVLPEWIFTLPKLTWLAYAGNPFSERLETQALESSMAGINWHQLDMNELLGEGASGLIYRASLSREEASHPVAVKLFKGAMTSDGLPMCEMASTMKAGQHYALTQTLGRIQHHPSGTDGLVMELIPNEFNNLAQPPSLESCTRDVYSSDKQFSTSALFKVAGAIADAVNHLHQQGVMHGDLYAHNILTTPSGEALLSDYGAASFFDAEESYQAARLQRLEARAFGCLLEELIARCDELAEDVRKKLDALVDQCLALEIMDRPTFEDICQVLLDISHQSQKQ
ncbi:leucine-rich repeat-containing protein kinase family protein [Vibrio diazotrophicus]|uniref:leucine-rich repeat-containing protein kinase family protein n=1 Tax=Vibrio diazotrophicus TaxID=685 RepID=UPI0022AF3DFC|nr:leucine-rich repeat-containing protein kinase family protein [Vibrio diazotrophicus]MCZ4371166.1 leucine-rich repeat-containing protein kinase family protein [Vibrio diazotrophicus]